MRRISRLAALVLLAAMAGCSSKTPNPSFQVTDAEARGAMACMSCERKKLDRPVVLIGGIYDPNVSPTVYRAVLGRAFDDDRFVGVAVGFERDFEACRRKVIEAVDAAFPSIDPEFTTEVDVIGASLGGLVGRYCAAPSRDPAHPRRLKINRLFTIASPHGGAVLANVGQLYPLHEELRPGSEFIKYVASRDCGATYELFAYARLSDRVVGEELAAPPGQNPLWLPTPVFQSGHSGAWLDPRILADILLRLRGETPFSTAPGEALPAKAS